MSRPSTIRRHPLTFFALLSTPLIAVCPPPAHAQCQPEWLPLPGQGVQGTNGVVHAMTTWDPDGPGSHPPLLILGGSFTAAGTAFANHIAAFDGTNWSSLGAGTNDVVRALAVFDDGTGPALYAAGEFSAAGAVAASRIAKWDGAAWSCLGTGMNSEVDALAAFDDGSGTALYAGGLFTTAGGVAASRIARWAGGNWSPVGTGMEGGVGYTSVNALTVFNDGGGSALYAGGGFTTAGGITANFIARWDGATWSPLGRGMAGGLPYVHCLTVFDDGTGAALYAGGQFTSAGGRAANRIAKWTGAFWFPVGDGVRGDIVFPSVNTLIAFDDGSGPALCAGGDFLYSAEAYVGRIAKWTGAGWSSLGLNLGGVTPYVAALAAFDDGNGSALFAGGNFRNANEIDADSIAKWTGADWLPLATALDSAVFALAAFDDGDGSALYAGGMFSTAGLVTVNRVARWNGRSWSALGLGVDGHQRQVLALAAFNDGSSAAPKKLYAGGTFNFADGEPANRIARWDGTSWSPVGTGAGGPSPYVHALTVFDEGSGPALYAGGPFTRAGGAPANHIAKWDGMIWSPLGAGLNGSVNALAVFDDGTGPALYVAGEFTTAGGASANRIARWNGAGWSSLGTGMNDDALALTVFNAGSPAAPDTLCAGGSFTTAGGVIANRVAKWDGTSWSALGTGMDADVNALATFNDGSGSALYAGGRFTSADGAPANRIARWNGAAWFPLDAGIGGSESSSSVNALLAFDPGDGPSLIVGGGFRIAGTFWSRQLARWGCPFLRGDLDCSGAVNFLDIDPFLLALTDPAGYAAAYPNCSINRADVNADDAVNLFDIDPFVACLFEGCP